MAQETSTDNQNARILIEDDGDEASDDASDEGVEQADDEEVQNEDAELQADDADVQGAESSALAVGEDKGEGVVAGHGFQIAMSFNGVPNGILDHWFAHHGEVWDGVASMGFALDYFLRFRVPCELRISLSWVNARAGDAYWLDKDHADSPILADYVHNDMSMINLEIAAYHIIDMADWAAFYYGGGLWGGVLLGDAKSYAIRSSCVSGNDNWTSCPHEPGSVPVTGVPPVVGFVMVSLGFKFKFLDVMTARVEAGFKGYFYGQLGLGVEF